MARTPRWYDPFPETTAPVDCGGEKHRVTWRRGKVVLEDHDLTAERAMLAFGGELCPCMRVLEMWVNQFRMAPEQFLQLRGWLGPKNAFLAPEEFALVRRLGMILSWERSWRATFYFRDKQGQLLSDELKTRALPALREHVNAWKVRAGARVVSGCQVALVPSNQPVTLAGTTDGVAMKVAAQLRATWVVDVWARGIATVDGAFVMKLDRALSTDDLRVVAGRWEPTGSRTWATVTAPARLRRGPGAPDEWHLEWEDAG
ncbi:MAG: hypothetical protein M3066_21440 [Actinomycetota bacterium]|nr:hypothetical protein [Actinomycetota bacterium]